MGPLLFKHNRLCRSALVVFLAVLFWAAQLLPALVDSAFCQMQSAAGQQGCQPSANHHHKCCCGGATNDHIGLRSQCCEVREAQRNPDQDFAVSLVPNVGPQDSIGLVTESRSTADFDLFTGATGALDWIKSKTLSKDIYLNNLNFLC
jgi:hypothetical protein